MAQEPYAHHIETIFDALHCGFKSRTWLSANYFKGGVSMEGPDLADIKPDVFNRGTVIIDGEKYCISVFRPQEAPVIDESEPPESSGGTEGTYSAFKGL